MNTKIPKEYIEMLNIDKILKNTENLEQLKVTLKHDKLKGTGLFATKHIGIGETISYYKMTTFDYHHYVSPTNYVYAFDVYTMNGRESKNLIGDIDLGSLSKPINNIPFWGFFVNEPSTGQKLNAEIDVNTEENYKGIQRMKCGKQLIYKLIATSDIFPDEEITLYYGKAYPRTYEINSDII